MRLLKLKIKNLASLKGEHLIDFEGIERESSLFAITGETGSGKSTILNSIGLALFGRVYKSNVTQHDLVTLGEKEGQIELLFQVKDKTYLSFWKVKIRKQNGELYSTPQSPQRELYLVEGKDFSSNKHITNKKIEDLIGLDFDQFCKCVILNQGEFARFLASSFTERKEILEKLYSGEMLESLGKELKLQLDILVKKRSDIEIELNTIKGDGPSAIDLYAQKENLEKQTQLFEDWLKQTESIDYHLVSLRSYHSKHSETKKKHLHIKEELSKETTVYNEQLTKVKKCEEAHTKLSQESLVRLPKLEALLKIEETLRSQQDQYSEKSKYLQKADLEMKAIKTQLENNTSAMNTWASEERKQVAAFHYPINQLLANKNQINDFIVLSGQMDLIEQDLQIKSSRLQEMELDGLNKVSELKSIQSHLALIPKDLSKQIEDLEMRKKEHLFNIEKQQLLQIKIQELNILLEKLKLDANEIEIKTTQLEGQLLDNKQDLLPLESTLKLQELMMAVEVCRLHPNPDNQCPVCETPINQQKWQELKSKIKLIDQNNIKDKAIAIQKTIYKMEEELAISRSRHQNILIEITAKQELLLELKNQLIPPTSDFKVLEDELARLNKWQWELGKIKQDETKLEEELKKSRDIYGKLKLELGHKEQQRSIGQSTLKSLLSPMEKLFTHDDKNALNLLKTDASLLPAYLEHQRKGEKTRQEKAFLDQNLEKIQSEHNLVSKEIKLLDEKIAESRGILKEALGDSSAIDQIRQLNQNLKDSSETYARQERELKNKAESMKLIQGQIYTFVEYLKDLDLQFTKELHTLRSMALVPLPFIREELKTLCQTCHSLHIDLDTPENLLIPITELSQKEKDTLKQQASEFKMELARVLERISSWEKRLDRIKLLELKLNEYNDQLQRKMRLYEVLGKDELRTFVLSLVEENLILVTNEELQKLCQGRYEIIHHAGRMRLPEFYIMDKFREGEMRKVSTLSGGETFMVSLAMAIGLAEMTRGQAEIDSLFIDEGFGTLDQESLQDVIDMLNQIQTRGLMVGIISHIKELTQSLPVNLHVSKKSDGTSSLSVIHN